MNFYEHSFFFKENSLFSTRGMKNHRRHDAPERPGRGGPAERHPRRGLRRGGLEDVADLPHRGTGDRGDLRRPDARNPRGRT